ncbi:TPA: hypothetical protein ACRNIP_003424, partial [Pseudomonas aeruginosa]
APRRPTRLSRRRRAIHESSDFIIGIGRLITGLLAGQAVAIEGRSLCRSAGSDRRCHLAADRLVHAFVEALRKLHRLAPEHGTRTLRQLAGGARSQCCGTSQATAASAAWCGLLPLPNTAG